MNNSAYSEGHLLVFSETHLDIFNTQTAEWVQSIGLKRSQPLSQQGNVVLTYVNDSPYVVYLANIHTSKYYILSQFTAIINFFTPLSISINCRRSISHQKPASD